MIESCFSLEKLFSSYLTVLEISSSYKARFKFFYTSFKLLSFFSPLSLRFCSTMESLESTPFLMLSILD